MKEQPRPHPDEERAKQIAEYGGTANRELAAEMQLREKQIAQYARTHKPKP